MRTPWPAGAEDVLAGFAAQSPPHSYDIVFLDPPYAADLAEVLGPAARLASEVLLVERATRSADVALPEGFEPVQIRRYGDSTLWYGWRS